MMDLNFEHWTYWILTFLLDLLGYWNFVTEAHTTELEDYKVRKQIISNFTNNNVIIFFIILTYSHFRQRASHE